MASVMWKELTAEDLRAKAAANAIVPWARHDE